MSITGLSVGVDSRIHETDSVQKRLEIEFGLPCMLTEASLNVFPS